MTLLFSKQSLTLWKNHSPGAEISWCLLTVIVNWNLQPILYTSHLPFWNLSTQIKISYREKCRL